MPPRSLLAPLLCLCLALGAMPVSPPASAQRPGEADQLLAAAEAAINVGDHRKAENLISRVPQGSLSLPQLARVQIVRAEISLKRGQPDSVLQALPSGSDHVPLQAERIEALRASALFALGDAVAAVRSLVQREKYLRGDAPTIQANRDTIWSGLMQTPLSQEARAQMAIQDEVTRGWLELAWAAQQGGGYDQWQARYPRHPAADRLAALRSAPPRPAALAANAAPGAAALPPATGNLPQIYHSGGGRGYALLLPLSGAYAPTGEALRDGFMSAYLGAGREQAPVRVYDSGGTPQQTLEAYQRALSEGAGLVVGPLPKDSVAALAQMGAPPVPVVALNYLESGMAPPNFLQLGLAPEDEARAAAEQAVVENRQRAVVLVPDNEWGDRVAAAFEQRLRERGGAVVASERFQAGEPDHSKVVRKLLSFDASEARHKALTAVLGRETEFEARRRADIDFIFLAAKPADGRSILPLLRFYRASGLPVYATSLIYDGRPAEVQGLSICDMPWMTDAQGSWAQARSDAQAAFADAMRDYPRLVALGADAWRVGSRLQEGRLPEDAMEAASGRLRLLAGGRIGRELGCARIGSASLADEPE